MIPTMRSSALITQALRARLRQRGMTYRQLADLLCVSEPTVKRDLSRGNFSLHRLDAMCDALGTTLDEIISGRPDDSAAVTQLDARQERALVREPALLLITYLLNNNWKLAEIEESFALDENELVNLLLKLDALRIVEFRPPRRIRKLTARNFSWRKDGPVHDFFIGRIAPEFLGGQFDQPFDQLHFLGGTLTFASAMRLREVLARLVDDFDETARQDSRAPLATRNGHSLLVAFRQWEYSEFTKLRRRR